MKYRFITILHNMKLDNIKNRGIQLFPGARISNGPQVLSETLETNLMQGTAGVHSVDEFKDTVYCYVDGDFEHITTKEEMDDVGTSYTFIFLREIQSFLIPLWEVKDNNVYVRDGFLIVYKNSFEDGFTYKGSLSEIFTYSTLVREDSIFTDDELKTAINKFEPTSIKELIKEEFDWKYPTDNHFFKKSNTERMDRALYFIMNARKTSILPMKIVSYCTALECLFTTGISEINHKIAERVAIFLGSTSTEKKEIFKLIKKAYDIRSTIVHGSSLKGDSDSLIDISRGLDIILRQLYVKNHEVFSKKDNDLEEFFVDLLFNNVKT